MINIILFTSLLYFVQLILPMSLAKRAGEAPAESARKALHNLRESLPVFFTFALLSIYLNVEASIQNCRSRTSKSSASSHNTTLSLAPSKPNTCNNNGSLIPSSRTSSRKRHTRQ